VGQHRLDLGLVEAPQSPEVAQTTAALGLRPVAKALGMSTSAMATRGLGMSARAHKRSMIPCSSGSCSGVTMCPCIDHRAILSENQYCPEEQEGRDDQDEGEGEPDRTGSR
jgi:hypothetical protein